MRPRRPETAGAKRPRTEGRSLRFGGSDCLSFWQAPAACAFQLHKPAHLLGARRGV